MSGNTVPPRKYRVDFRKLKAIKPLLAPLNPLKSSCMLEPSVGAEAEFNVAMFAPPAPTPSLEMQSFPFRLY
jgi:hypothetical protein